MDGAGLPAGSLPDCSEKDPAKCESSCRGGQRRRRAPRWAGPGGPVSGDLLPLKRQDPQCREGAIDKVISHEEIQIMVQAFAPGSVTAARRRTDFQLTSCYHKSSS